MGIKERESTNEYYEDNIVIGMYDSKPMKTMEILIKIYLY